MEDQKLWPVEQLLVRLDTVKTKFLTVKPPQLWLLICLLKFADNTTLICFPSIARLSNISGFSESTVHRYLRDMEKVGVLQKRSRFTKKGDPESNEYKILPTKLWGTGCYCPYPPVRLTPPPVRLTPPSCQADTLTTNLTMQLSKKPGAAQEKDKTHFTDVTKQSTSYGVECESREDAQRIFEENLRMWNAQKNGCKPN